MRVGGAGVGVAARLALPVLAALVVVPFVKPGGSLLPWAPSTVDLDVYQYIGRVLLSHGDILAARVPETGLAFIYPPFAALLCVPLAFVPHLLLQAIWTAGNALLVVLVLHRIGLRAWVLSLVATGCVLLVEPVRETIGFGQINLLLMALVVIDLVPGALGRVRLLPTGVLTGLAASLKVTPALFGVYLLLARRRRAGLVVIGTVAVLTAGAALLLPQETIGFASALANGQTRTESAAFRFNQSVLAATLRLAGENPVASYAGLALGAAAAVVGVCAAARWDRRGEPVLAVALCGTATLLASPLSWTHHFVWIVPLGLVVYLRRDLPRGLRIAAGAFVLWMGVAAYKVIPWVYDAAPPLSFAQDLVSGLGPLLGVVVLVTAFLSGAVSGADLRRDGQGVREKISSLRPSTGRTTRPTRETPTVP